MAIIPSSGKLQNIKNLKAGTARAWISDAPTAYTPSGTTADTLGAAISSTSATTVTVATGATFSVNDIVEIPSTGEKMLVTGIATNDLTVIRGYDGTIAATASDGVVINRVGLGFVTAATTGIDATSITIEDDTNLAADMIARPQYNVDSDERILITAVTTASGDDTLTVWRDFNLNRAKSEYTYSYADQDGWVVEFVSFKNAFSDTTNWLEIETEGGITISEDRATIETHSDQRGTDKTFIDTVKWTVSFSSPLTDPVIMGYYDQIQYLNSNNGQRKGSSLVSRDGKQLTGIMLYIEGQESADKECWFLYDVAMSDKGDTPYTKDQRMTDLTFNCQYKREMAACGSNTIAA
jgi:hypothetical protein